MQVALLATKKFQKLLHWSISLDASHRLVITALSSLCVTVVLGTVQIRSCEVVLACFVHYLLPWGERHSQNATRVLKVCPASVEIIHGLAQAIPKLNEQVFKLFVEEHILVTPYIANHRLNDRLSR